MQTIVEQDAENEKARVIGSMIYYLPVEVGAIQKALASTDDVIKIVSLTVTEGGYYLKDGKLDIQHKDIQHDIGKPEDPQTIFGILVKALKEIKESDGKRTPFSVMSCDNVPHNGTVAKSVVMQLAEQQSGGTDFSSWIEENVGFPNSMVGRITPASTEMQRDHVKKEFGYEDQAPVFCEPFRQWVIEDKFSKSGRPDFDTLDNVRFVEDVTPYEFMKIRVLNGGHASLCYPGALMDLDYVHDTMEHPTISAFLDCLEKAEIIPTVGKVPDTDLQDYWKIIQDRFSNPTIQDTLRRNCFDGASRQPKFVIPIAKENLEAKRPVDGLGLVSAMWCRYCQGTTESGATIEPNDPQWDRLHKTALKAKDDNDPTVWLNELVDVYGESVAKNPDFVECFSKALTMINSEGVEVAMKKYIESKTK